MPGTSRFQPGQVIAHRYAIDRWCGSGSSGEVYAVRDRELGIACALKVLAYAPWTEEGSLGRFKREVLLARRISHPNVCRMFDFGTHEEPGREPAYFLTMELLEGRTLSSLLEEKTRLPEQEALDIGRQLAAGLAAAHRAGVVHRDLKCSNVMLVPADGGARAVITDFGLARARETTGATVTMTQNGAVLGTPAYMAPEQLSGHRIDGRTDLYSLGIILFEMLSGELPFEGASPISMALKRLNERPRSLAGLVPGLSRRTLQIVEKCLESDPADRFQSAEELLEALTSEVRIRWSSARRKRSWSAAGIAALVAAIAWWASLREETPGPAASRPRVALLGIRVLPEQPEQQWLGAALAEMLATELSAPGDLSIVPSALVEALKRDLQLRDSASFHAESIGKLRRILGTDREMIGVLIRLQSGDSPRLRLDLREALPGKTPLSPVAVEGSEEDLSQLATDAGLALRRALGLGAPVSDPGSDHSRLWQLRTPASVRAYGEGLAELARGRPLEAVPRLEEAVRLDPQFALAQLQLARIFWELGHQTRAIQVAEAAFRASLGLPEEERFWIEAHYRRFLGEHEAARELLELWRRRRAGDFERDLEFAALLIEGGNAAQALGVLEEAAAGSPLAFRDPRVLWLSAQASGALSKFEEQLRHADAMRSRAREVGAVRFELLAELERAAALRRLGRPEEARAVLEHATRLAQEVGDSLLEARSWELLGQFERSQGRWSEAKGYLSRALERFLESGNVGAEARVLLALGSVALGEGNPHGAITQLRQAVTRLEEIDQPETRNGAEIALAGALAVIGAYEEGEARYAIGCDGARRLGKKAGEGYCLLGWATVALARGDLERYLQLAAKAEAIAGETGDRRLQGLALSFRAEAQLAQDRLDEAIAEAERARRILEAAGAGQNAREVEWLELRARIEKEPAAAGLHEKLARFVESLEVGTAIRAGSELQWAEAVRVQLRVDPGSVSRRAIEARMPALLKSAEFLVRTTARLLEAELALVAGNRARATALGEQLLEEVSRAGSTLFAWEVRILLARASDAPLDLAAVLGDAEKRGFRLLARLAREESVLESRPDANDTAVRARSSQKGNR